jgi:hypothetical protein
MGLSFSGLVHYLLSAADLARIASAAKPEGRVCGETEFVISPELQTGFKEFLARVTPKPRTDQPVTSEGTAAVSTDTRPRADAAVAFEKLWDGVSVTLLRPLHSLSYPVELAGDISVMTTGIMVVTSNGKTACRITRVDATGVEVVEAADPPTLLAKVESDPYILRLVRKATGPVGVPSPTDPRLFTYRAGTSFTAKARVDADQVVVLLFDLTRSQRVGDPVTTLTVRWSERLSAEFKERAASPLSRIDPPSLSRNDPSRFAARGLSMSGCSGSVPAVSVVGGSRLTVASDAVSVRVRRRRASVRVAR